MAVVLRKRLPGQVVMRPYQIAFADPPKISHVAKATRIAELRNICILRKTTTAFPQQHSMSVTLHTSLGDIKIEVFCESVPKTAENFLALCASGYYDQSPFHRLIPGFMVQTGGPAHPSPPENPKGGRSIWGGVFDDEIRPALRHGERGIVSMANKGPGTNGSQFFVVFDKAPHLDGLNTVFGKVIGDDGFATLAKMEKVEVDKKNRPRVPFTIDKVTMHANPLAG